LCHRAQSVSIASVLMWDAPLIALSHWLYSLVEQIGRNAVALDPVILSRLQFGFVISFHIIFPSFTIGLAAWLATIEGARRATGKAIYRRVFDFWIKIFALPFGVGVVTGSSWCSSSARIGA
jgi:hypothetical protein